MHTDLRRHGLIPDPFYGENEKALQWIESLDWRYRTTFFADPELIAQPRLDLVAEGLDTLATLSLNGQVVGRTENMFCGYRFAEDYGVFLAGTFLSILPIAVLFLALQREFIAGLTSGAVKG